MERWLLFRFIRSSGALFALAVVSILCCVGIMTYDAADHLGLYFAFVGLILVIGLGVALFVRVLYRLIEIQKAKIASLSNSLTESKNLLMQQREAARRADAEWADYTWRCLFENSPYPVCMTDAEGFVVRMNKAYGTVVTSEDAGHSMLSLFDESDAVSCIKAMKAMSSHEKDAPNILKARMKDSGRVLELGFGSMLDLDGKFQAFVVRISDISCQEHIEDNLSHAQRMQTIGQLVGSVAHDFNNILTAVSGFCDLLLLRHGIGDPSFPHIMQIKQSADRATSLIQRLLAFSRKQTMQVKRISTVDMLADFAPMIRRLIGSRMQLTQKIEPDIWDINADLVQLEQVILNLIVNAQQAMGIEGKLDVTVSNITVSDESMFSGYARPPGEGVVAKGMYVSISVRDNGCGIDPAKMSRIFEPFYTTKMEMSGTGLGLSTVYGVMKQLRGYVLLQSEVDVGTEFIILIPRASGAVEITDEDEVDISDSLTLMKVSGYAKVILVEDEDAIRIFVKSVLTLKGYNVIDFGSPDDALKYLGDFKNAFDLIITDVMMPEMSGPTFIERVRKMHFDPKVIFISGFGEEAFTDEYGDRREFHFLSKPFSLKQLIRKVYNVLAGTAT